MYYTANQNCSNNKLRKDVPWHKLQYQAFLLVPVFSSGLLLTSHEFLPLIITKGFIRLYVNTKQHEYKINVKKALLKFHFGNFHFLAVVWIGIGELWMT